MPNREEALRKIFEATGPRLSDDQTRELLAHLDDAVEAKVDAGVPEMEAVGQAFAELGSLKKLRFPEPAPAVVTTSGGLVEPWIGGGAEMGYLLLLMFTFIQLLVTPALVNVFVQVRVALPRATILFWNLSDAMRTYWPLVAIALAALGVLLVRVPLAGVLLPFVSLIESIAR
jgi:hypothetical protein